MALSPLAACSPQTALNLLTPASGYRLDAGLRYGPEPDHVVDVYTPAAVPDAATAIVFLHGGRWSYGSRRDYKFVAGSLTARGFVVAIPDYRKYPLVRFPTFVEDAALAVAWLRSTAADHGADPSRIVVVGHSAGAHIAAMLATDDRYLEAHGLTPRALAGMVGMAGPYDFLPLTDDDLRDMFGPEEQWPESQPVEFVDGDEPPMLLLHGLRDRSVHPRNSRRLARRVREAGGSAEVRTYERLDHLRIVGALAGSLTWLGPVLDDLAEFAGRVGAPHR